MEEDSESDWGSEDDPDRLWCICRKPYANRYKLPSSPVTVGVGDYWAAITDDHAMCGRNYLSCLNLCVMTRSMILTTSAVRCAIVSNSK